MRINTNVSALNAQRQRGATNAAVSQSISRLSSGFRINRAADDAAGLGIANKLRGDIRSMTQAARNGEQANSLAQIAEGAVSGIQKMLERMKELATQANSDTVDSSGRDRLQAEFDALRSEIGRTASTTQFGKTKLIDGNFGSGVNSDVAVSTILGSTTVFHAATSSGATAGTYTIANDAAGQLTISDSAGTRTQTVTLTSSGSQTVNFSEFGISVELTAAYDNAVNTNVVAGDLVIAAGANGGGDFMVGSSGSYASDDLLTFESIDMTTATFGLTGLDLNSATNARAALSALDGSIDTVNEALGKIGAFQNRVENAVANLKTSIENLSASESVIRDLDMAEEMTRFSKNQILAQAGTAMLAQANQSSQGVLQLLRG